MPAPIFCIFIERTRIPRWSITGTFDKIYTGSIANSRCAILQFAVRRFFHWPEIAGEIVAIMSTMLDESKFENAHISSKETSIVFANTKRVSADRNKLQRFVVENLINVTQVRIDKSSLLESPWFVEFLEKLETLTIDGKNIETLEPLKGWKRPRCLIMEKMWRKNCNIDAIATIAIPRLMIAAKHDGVIDAIVRRGSFTTLGLIDYGATNFEPLNSISADEIDFFGGQIVSAVGFQFKKVRKVLFERCKHLKTVNGLVTSELRIESCANLDMSSIACISDLRKIEIISKELCDIEFCRHLSRLEDISLLSPTTFVDLSPLQSLPMLHRVWINTSHSGMTDEMHRASTRNRGMIICNGTVCFQGGLEIPPAHYYDSEK